VDDVWPHVRYDIVDDFTLEDQGAAHVVVRVGAVDMITIIEHAVLGEVEAVTGKLAVIVT